MLLPQGRVQRAQALRQPPAAGRPLRPGGGVDHENRQDRPLPCRGQQRRIVILTQIPAQPPQRGRHGQPATGAQSGAGIGAVVALCDSQCSANFSLPRVVSVSTKG